MSERELHLTDFSGSAPDAGEPEQQHQSFDKISLVMSNRLWQQIKIIVCWYA
jgi:hypothetical protein